MSIVGRKTCSVCGETKWLDEFPLNSRAPYPHVSHRCRSCNVEAVLNSKQAALRRKGTPEDKVRKQMRIQRRRAERVQYWKERRSI